MIELNILLTGNQTRSDLVILSKKTGVSEQSLAELAISLGFPETLQKTSSASGGRTLSTAQSQLSDQNFEVSPLRQFGESYPFLAAELLRSLTLLNYQPFLPCACNTLRAIDWLHIYQAPSTIVSKYFAFHCIALLTRASYGCSVTLQGGSAEETINCPTFPS